MRIQLTRDLRFDRAGDVLELPDAIGRVLVAEGAAIAAPPASRASSAPRPAAAQEDASCPRPFSSSSPSP